MSTQILTISEINNYIKTLMDHDMILHDVLVKGEISNFKLHYSGHMYLTLKDENSVIKSVMFKGSNSKLKFDPKDGMKIIAQGRISVYERSGQYQLYIEDMQPDGVGALHIAFEQLKEKLQKEGLFKEDRKKELPKYPKRIGVVTSSTGAAIRDILNILGRRYPYADIYIYPALVQGEQASYQVSEGIEYFNNKKMADVIIIGRGGGSIEDLWAFNEEILARSIAGSSIPIVSAVGHETDFTIADFVSDLRAPTPSAAAEIIVPSQYELREKINTLKSRLYQYINKEVEIKRKNLNNLMQSHTFRNPLDKINQHRVLLDDNIRHLMRNILLQIQNKRENLGTICAKLDALSPLSVISRGYAIIRSEDNKVLKNIDDISIKENIKIKLINGEVYCEVQEIVPE